MKCPICGNDMKSGYLQTARLVAFNKKLPVSNFWFICTIADRIVHSSKMG